MRKVQVSTPGGEYPVFVGHGAVDKLPALLQGRGSRVKRRPPSGVHLVSDRRVARRWSRPLIDRLDEVGLPFSRTTVPAGEASKSFTELERVVRDAIRQGRDRASLLIALGGGVVGDLTGYAAASLLRGVDFLQIPTSLLAMVDASVGGKTGINVAEGKNLVGAFHQPIAVLADLDYLETLPARQVSAGWAEVIKTAMIRDVDLLRLIEDHTDALLAREPRWLERVVARCVEIKANVVSEDEREGGVRRILNFGHTLAHGIETSQDYEGLLHGEAVAVGMVFAARLSESLGRSEPGIVARLESILRAFKLPVSLRGAQGSRILSAMERDKKRGPEGLRWVFCPRVGEAVVAEDVDAGVWRGEVRRFLAAPG